MVGKAIIGLAMLALAGFAQAQPHGRYNHAMAHKMYKKEVVWVTVTKTMTFGAAATPSPPTVVQSPPAIEAPPVVEKNVNLQSTNTNTGGGSTGGLSGLRGITYSAKDDSGACKSAGAVKSDLAQLGEYNMIRFYGPECHHTQYLLDFTDKKVFAGLWNVDTYESAMADLKIIADEVNGRWDRIHSISVGNELVQFGKKNAGDLRNLVARVRTTLRDQYGYKGNVVTTDTLAKTKESKELCDAGDYIAVNCHPFFDPNMSASNSGDFIANQIQELKNFCNNGKEVFITETGWPKHGDNSRSGERAPTKENQRKAIESIKSKLGDKFILLSAFNEKWKGEGSIEQARAEAYWGVLDN